MGWSWILVLKGESLGREKRLAFNFFSLDGGQKKFRSCLYSQSFFWLCGNKVTHPFGWRASE